MSAGPAAQLSPDSASPASQRIRPRTPTPKRAVLRFVLCLVYALVARQVAERSARGFVSQDWVPLVASAMFAFLLLMGFAGLGYLLDGEHDPIAAQGLPGRKGWVQEIGLGVAIGWGIAL